ncbi:unnamed protein product [Closterium sp. NIES-54]
MAPKRSFAYGQGGGGSGGVTSPILDTLDALPSRPLRFVLLLLLANFAGHYFPLLWSDTDRGALLAGGWGARGFSSKGAASGEGMGGNLETVRGRGNRTALQIGSAGSDAIRGSGASRLQGVGRAGGGKQEDEGLGATEWERRGARSDERGGMDRGSEGAGAGAGAGSGEGEGEGAVGLTPYVRHMEISVVSETVCRGIIAPSLYFVDNQQPISAVADLRGGQRRVLLFMPRHGLGNSLRGYVSAFVYARLSGRRLVRLHAAEHAKVPLGGGGERSTLLCLACSLSFFHHSFQQRILFPPFCITLASPPPPLPPSRARVLAPLRYGQVYDTLCAAFTCGFDAIRWSNESGPWGGTMGVYRQLELLQPVQLQSAFKTSGSQSPNSPSRCCSLLSPALSCHFSASRPTRSLSPSFSDSRLPSPPAPTAPHTRPLSRLAEIKSSLGFTGPIMLSKSPSHFDGFWQLYPRVQACVFSAFRCSSLWCVHSRAIHELILGPSRLLQEVVGQVLLQHMGEGKPPVPSQKGVADGDMFDVALHIRTRPAAIEQIRGRGEEELSRVGCEDAEEEDEETGAASKGKKGKSHEFLKGCLWDCIASLLEKLQQDKAARSMARDAAGGETRGSSSSRRDRRSRSSSGPLTILLTTDNEALRPEFVRRLARLGSVFYSTGSIVHLSKTASTDMERQRMPTMAEFFLMAKAHTLIEAGSYMSTFAYFAGLLGNATLASIDWEGGARRGRAGGAACGLKVFHEGEAVDEYVGGGWAGQQGGAGAWESGVAHKGSNPIRFAARSALPHQSRCPALPCLSRCSAGCASPYPARALPCRLPRRPALPAHRPAGRRAALPCSHAALLAAGPPCPAHAPPCWLSRRPAVRRFALICPRAHP